MTVGRNEDSEALSPGVALSKAIDSDSVGLIASASDVAIDAFISSGVLDGVPILGLLTGSMKAFREVRDELYFRRVLRFLQNLRDTTAVERSAFVENLEAEGELEHFGETILLILDRIDDVTKPRIIGRILSAHISGKITSYNTAMRLIAMVNRAYAADFHYLRSFRPGVQEDHDVAASLAAVGLLANSGIDGGSSERGTGGYIYELNDYGNLLVSHGLT